MIYHTGATMTGKNGSTGGHTIPYHVIPYHIKPYHIIPHYTIPHHTISYLTPPDHFLTATTKASSLSLGMLCTGLPYRTIPYHTIPYHTIHTVSYLLTKASNLSLGILFTASILFKALAHRSRRPRFSHSARRERSVGYRESTCIGE